MQHRSSIAAPRQPHATSSAPMRGVGQVVSLLLALALLAQGAVLLIHTHLASASVGAVADARQDGPPADRGPADPDAADCDVCATLSQCRATALPPPPDASAAPSVAAHDLVLETAAAPREPAPTGCGARSPPSALV